MGSRSFLRGTVDATGPIAGTNMAYRLNAIHLTSDSWRDNETIRKTAVYPSFLWQVTKKTQVSVDMEFHCRCRRSCSISGPKCGG